MDPKAEWVRRVLGLDIAAPIAGGDAALTPDMLLKGLRDRVIDCVTQAKLLPDKSALPALVAIAGRANTAIKSGDVLAAELATDALETMLTEARRASTKTGLEQVKGRVSYRKAQVDWRTARTVAMGRVEALSARTLADPRVRDDPGFDELAAAIGQFGSLLPEFDTLLEAQLEELDAAGDPSARAPLIEDARETVADYRALLAESEALSALQSLSDDEYGGIDIVGALSAALLKVEQTLNA